MTRARVAHGGRPRGRSPGARRGSSAAPCATACSAAPTTDLDLALPGDPKDAARALARATGGAAFRLSGAFGAWRVVGPGHAWHVDLVTLRDGDIRADLAARDFTVNAMAEPLAGGELLDPHGGRADLEARRLRMVGPDALADDPLRTLRAVRIAIDLDLHDRAGDGGGDRPRRARARARRRRARVRRAQAGDLARRPCAPGCS